MGIYGITCTRIANLAVTLCTPHVEPGSWYALLYVSRPMLAAHRLRLLVWTSLRSDCREGSVGLLSLLECDAMNGGRAIDDNQRQSTVINCNQWQPMAIMGAIRRGTSRRVNLGAIRTLGASHLLQEI